MESVDTLEATMELVFDLLDEPELRDGPSAGVVMQAYLRESPEQLERVIDWARAQRAPAAARGAAREGRLLGPRGGGGAPARLDAAGVRGRSASPTATSRRSPRRLLEAWPHVRPAIASHNLRSVAHAIAATTASSAARTATSSSRCCAGSATSSPPRSPQLGLRVRIYCPVGDLVAGMAYLVRRLLENTSNESFLGDQQRGVPIEELLAAP